MSEAATQYADIPLGGVDTDTALELVAAPKSLDLVNCELQTGIAASRRRGFNVKTDSSIINGSSASSLSAVRAIAGTGNGDLMALDTGRLYQWQQAEQRWAENQKAAFPVSRVTPIGVGTSLGSAVAVDVAKSNSGAWTCVAAVDSKTDTLATLTLIDDASGVVRRTDQISLGAAASTAIGIVASGTSFVFCYYDSAANKIRCAVLSLLNISAGWGAAQDIVTTRAAIGWFDAIDDGGSNIFIAYTKDSAGSPAVASVAFTISGGVVAISANVTYGVGTKADKCITLALIANGAKMAICYCDAAVGVVAIEITPTTLVFIATWVVDAVITTAIRITLTGYLSSGVYHGFLAYSTPMAAAFYDVTTYFRDLNVVAHTTTVPGRPTELGVGLTHKAFVRNESAWDGLVFVGLGRQGDFSDLQGTSYTYLDRDGAARFPVAQYSPLTAQASWAALILPTYRGLSHVLNYSGARFRWAGSTAGAQPLGTGPFPSKEFTVYDCDFTPDLTDHSIVVRDRLLMVASIPSVVSLDARTDVVLNQATERALEGLAHLHSPPQPTLTDSASAGALVATQTYFYKAVYYYVDRDGRAHTSVTSLGVSRTLGAGKTAVDVVAPPGQAPMPAYGAPVVRIYRTTGNATQLIYYFLREVASGTTFTDTLADTSLAIGGTLYTSSGELDNFSPPPTAALALWKSRILALNSEDGSVWHSKTIIDGEWPGFHAALSVRTDVHRGMPMFITADEDKVIVWWDDAIGVIYGEPANDLGQGGTLQAPIMLPTRGVGLRDRKSLVRTPLGTFFAADRGMYLLDQSLQLQFIGKDVSAYAAQAIVAGVLLEIDSEVRFLTATGLTLVYDYNVNEWHTHQVTASDGAWTSACIWKDQMMVANSSTGNKVWQQTVGDTDDPVGTLATKWTSAYIKTTGPLGRQRARKVWLLGTYVPGTTTVQIDYDFAGTWAESHACTDARRMEIKLAQQECSAFSVRVQGFTRHVMMRIEVEAEKSALRRAVGVG